MKDYSCREDDLLKKFKVMENMVPSEEHCLADSRHNFRNEYLENDTIASACIFCAFGIRHKALNNDLHSNYEMKGKWQRLWLRHCLRPETDYFFLLSKGYKDIKGSYVSREADVRRIIKEGLSDNDSPLAMHIGPERGIARYKEVIRDWFLQRYNWKDAYLLSFGKNKSIVPCLSFLLILIFDIFFLTSITIGKMLSLPPSALRFLPLGMSHGISNVPEMASMQRLMQSAHIGIPLMLEIITCVFLSLLIIIMFKRRYTDFFFTRLLVTIFIGLLPLITQDVTWNFPLRLSWGMVYGLSSLLFIASLLYTYIECNRSTSFTFLKTLFRSLPVTLYGLLISLFLSIFACDIMAMHFIDYNKIIFSTAYRGIFGLIYPKIVVLFAFSSLLIGIFIQIFWEEKTITDVFQ